MKTSKTTDVTCPICGAGKGAWCTGPSGGRRPPHGDRVRKAKTIYRARREALAAARKRRGKRMEGMTVRFECPVCGGDHSRADHGRATAPTDAISKALAGRPQAR